MKNNGLSLTKLKDDPVFYQKNCEKKFSEIIDNIKDEIMMELRKRRK